MYINYLEWCLSLKKCCRYYYQCYYYHYWLIPLLRNNSEKSNSVSINIRPNESQMAKSFLLSHSLKMIGPRVSKEFFCNTSQYISIITFRKMSRLLAFPFTDFPMHIVFPIETKKFYDSKSLLFTQAGSGHRHPGTPGAQPVLTGREGGIKETDLTIELVQMYWQQSQVRLRMIWGAQFSESGEITGAQAAGRTESQDREGAMAVQSALKCLLGKPRQEMLYLDWANVGE